MKKTLFFLCLALFTFSSMHAQLQQQPKNVILLIGDGMGLAQIYSFMSVRDQTAFDEFRYIGLSKTFSADDYTTDSAAGGTALAAGEKTNNGYIGVNPNKEAIPNLVEKSKRKGKSTGVVSACSVTHATPASFVAHQASRKMDEEIAADFTITQPDVFIGGGRDYFEKRSDKRNLTDSLKARKYNVVYTMNDLQNSGDMKTAALLYDVHPPKASERGDYLPKASSKAIELLSQNPAGFFMMIEGSQIDWACHNNDFPYMMGEMEDFNTTILAALEFAKKDKQTLVIVTADHETGGLTLLEKDKNGDIEYNYSTKKHSAVPVPVWAFGPGAQEFGGIYNNTEIEKKIARLLKLEK